MNFGERVTQFNSQWRVKAQKSLRKAMSGQLPADRL